MENESIDTMMPDEPIRVKTDAVEDEASHPVATIPADGSMAVAAVPDAPMAAAAADGTMYTEERVLDITKSAVARSMVEPLYLRRGEGEATVLKATVLDGGEPMNVSGYSVTFKLLNPDKQYVDVPASVDNAANGEVSVVISHDMTEISGTTEIAYFEFSNGSRIATTNDIPIVILASNDLTAADVEAYQTEIDKLVEQLGQKVITSVTVEYAIGYNNTTVPANGWSTSLPVAGSGSWLWSRRTETYRDGTKLVKYDYAYQGKDNASYGVATPTTQGLMSGQDKKNLDDLKAAWDSAGNSNLVAGCVGDKTAKMYPSQDANDISKPGIYSVLNSAGASLHFKNIPTGGNYGVLLVLAYDDSRIAQACFLMSASVCNVYLRFSHYVSTDERRVWGQWSLLHTVNA